MRQAYKHGGLVATLADRTARLAAAASTQQELQAELAEARRLLEAHQVMLAQCSDDLVARTADLVATRTALVERTDELVATRAQLADCNGQLEALGVQHAASLSESTAGREALSRHVDELAARSADLIILRNDLQQVRATLVERTERLEEAIAEAAATRARRAAADAESVLRQQALDDMTANYMAARNEIGMMADQLNSIQRAPIRYAYISHRGAIGKRLTKKR